MQDWQNLGAPDRSLPITAYCLLPAGNCHPDFSPHLSFLPVCELYM